MSKTHAIASKKKAYGDTMVTTCCGRSGAQGTPGGVGRRVLITAPGDHIYLHDIGSAPTCKTCATRSKFTDWSV